MSFLLLALWTLSATLLLHGSMAGPRKQAREQFARTAALGPGEYEIYLNRRDPFSPGGAVFSLLLLGLAWCAWHWGGWGWLRFGGSILLLGTGAYTLFNNLERLHYPPGLGRFIRTAALLAGFAGALGISALQFRAEVEARHREAAEKAAVDSIAMEKHTWTPGWGVTEASAGQVTAWLALPPLVLLDWEHEKKLESRGEAERMIPIDVVLLNNSFEDVPIDTGAAGELLRIRITPADSDRILREFRPAPGLEETLTPARRADFPVDWDGRDHAGALLPPGDYRVHLQTARFSPEGKSIGASAGLTLRDEGPREDPMTAYPRETLRWRQLHDQMRTNLEMMQRMQFENMRLQRGW